MLRGIWFDKKGIKLMVRLITDNKRPGKNA
jgi:hypothetical protein